MTSSMRLETDCQLPFCNVVAKRCPSRPTHRWVPTYSATPPTITYEIHRLVISRQQWQWAGPFRPLNFVMCTHFCASCCYQKDHTDKQNYKATFLVVVEQQTTLPDP